jgi:hypothetical protein
MKKTIRLTESELVKIVKRIINEQTEGESELIKVLDNKFGLSDELKQEISNALKSSECKNVVFQKLKNAAGLALWNRLVLNPDILTYSLGKVLFVLFHEMAHQYQYKKYGKEKMTEYYNEEISLSDAAKFLQNTEKVADEFAVRKLKSLERKGLIKLNDGDIQKGYEHMSTSQFESLVSFFRQMLKQNNITGSDQISEFLYNMVKIESSDNLEAKNHQKDTNTKSDTNIRKSDTNIGKSDTNIGKSDDETTTLQNLENVDGDLDLSRSKFKSIENLTSVGGDLNLTYSNVKSLGSLQSVGGNLNLRYTDIESLGNLSRVGGNLFLTDSNLTSLENLISVGGDLSLYYTTTLESLGSLQSVGRDLDLYKCNIQSLGGLKYVGRNLNLEKTPLSKIYVEEEIRRMVDVKGKVFL